MNLIEHLERDHAELRALLNAAESILGKPRGVGLDDRLSTDKKLLIEALKNFLIAFEKHEEAESRVIERLLRLEKILSARPLDDASSNISAPLRESISEGHRSLRSITHLLGAIASSHDSDQIYSIRNVVSSLKDELSRHLDYEEHEIFPKLKDALSAETLDKMTRWAKNIKKSQKSLK